MEANISEYTEALWGAVYPKAAVSHILPSVMTLSKYPVSNIFTIATIILHFKFIPYC